MILFVITFILYFSLIGLTERRTIESTVLKCLPIVSLWIFVLLTGFELKKRLVIMLYADCRLYFKAFCSQQSLQAAHPGGTDILLLRRHSTQLWALRGRYGRLWGGANLLHISFRFPPCKAMVWSTAVRTGCGCSGAHVQQPANDHQDLSSNLRYPATDHVLAVACPNRLS